MQFNPSTRSHEEEEEEEEEWPTHNQPTTCVPQDELFSLSPALNLIYMDSQIAPLYVLRFILHLSFFVPIK